MTDEDIVKEATGMSIDDFSELCVGVMHEVYNKERQIAALLKDLNDLLHVHKDVAKVMHVGIIFAAMSDDVRNDKTTLDAITILGSPIAVAKCVSTVAHEIDKED